MKISEFTKRNEEKLKEMGKDSEFKKISRLVFTQFET